MAPGKAKTHNKETGGLGEEVACIYLERRGFTVVDRNYTKPWGEIDIVAEKDGIVHFIEVKAVSRGTFDDGSRESDYRPEELATRAKLHKVSRTATLYMESKRDEREYQVDVIGVLLDQEKKVARCRFFDQALESNM